MARNPHRTPAGDASVAPRRVLDIGVAGLFGVVAAAIGPLCQPAAGQEAPPAGAPSNQSAGGLPPSPGGGASAGAAASGVPVTTVPATAGATPASQGGEASSDRLPSDDPSAASPDVAPGAPVGLASLAPLLRLRLGVDDARALDVMTTGPPGGEAGAEAPGASVAGAGEGGASTPAGLVGAPVAGASAPSEQVSPGVAERPSQEGPSSTPAAPVGSGPPLEGAQQALADDGSNSVAGLGVIATDMTASPGGAEPGVRPGDGQVTPPAGPAQSAPPAAGAADAGGVPGSDPSSSGTPAPRGQPERARQGGFRYGDSGRAAAPDQSQPRQDPAQAEPVLAATAAVDSGAGAVVADGAAPMPAAPVALFPSPVMPATVSGAGLALPSADFAAPLASNAAVQTLETASPPRTESPVISPSESRHPSTGAAAHGAVPEAGQAVSPAPTAVAAQDDAQQISLSDAQQSDSTAGKAASGPDGPVQVAPPAAAIDVEAASLAPTSPQEVHTAVTPDPGGLQDGETAAGPQPVTGALDNTTSDRLPGPALSLATPAASIPAVVEPDGALTGPPAMASAVPSLDEAGGQARRGTFRFGATGKADPRRPPQPVLSSVPSAGVALPGPGQVPAVSSAVAEAPDVPPSADIVPPAASPPASAQPQSTALTADVASPPKPAAEQSPETMVLPGAPPPGMAVLPPPGDPAASENPQEPLTGDGAPGGLPAVDQPADSTDAAAIARSFAREALGETVGDAASPPAAGGEATPGAAPPTTSEASSSASPPADRADGAETLADAILAAITGNPDILSAQARRDDAKYAMRQSRAALLPNVDLMMSEGVEGTRSETSPIEQANRAEAQIALRQLIWDFGAAGNDVKRARAVYEGVDWALRNEVERVAFDVAAAYIGVLERQQLAALAEENVAAHERILQTVQNQRQFGLVSGADVSRVEAKLNAARGALLDRRSDLAVAKEGFRRQLNRLPGDLAPAPLAGPLIPEDVEATLELAEKGNPELRQATALLESLRRQTAGQRAGLLPRIEFEAQGNWKDNVGGPAGRSDDARAMVTMRYKLYDGGAQSAAVSRAKAKLRQAEFDFDRTRRDIVQLVRSDYAALAAARDKVAAIEQEVQAGERLVDLYITQFRAGGRSVFDLLDSQETLIAGKSKRISNVAAREIAAYRVLKNIGELFIVATGEKFEAAPSR